MPSVMCHKCSKDNIQEPKVHSGSKRCDTLQLPTQYVYVARGCFWDISEKVAHRSLKVTFCARQPTAAFSWWSAVLRRRGAVRLKYYYSTAQRGPFPHILLSIRIIRHDALGKHSIFFYSVFSYSI